MTAAQGGEGQAASAALRLLRAEASLYERLEQCSQRQRSLVAEENVGPLLNLLAERRRLADELTRIGEALAPIKRGWSAFRARLSPDQQREAKALIESSRASLRRLIERDEEDARILMARKQAAARALRETQASSAALSAYRAPAVSPTGRNRVDEEVS